MNCRHRWLVSVVSFVLVLSACARARPPVFTITYENAEGLRPGQFLVYHGVRVGEVTAVSLEESGAVRIEARAFKEHRDRLYREAEYVIAKPGGLLDLSGEKQITVNDRAGERTPVQTGDVIAGTEGILGRIVSRAQDAGKRAVEAGMDALETGKEAFETGKSLATELSRLAEDIGSRPEVRDLRKAMEEVAEQAGRLTAEEYREFRRKTVPGIREEARKHKGRLEREGRIDEAKRFWEAFTKWVEEVRKGEPSSSD